MPDPLHGHPPEPPGKPERDAAHLPPGAGRDMRKPSPHDDHYDATAALDAGSDPAPPSSSAAVGPTSAVPAPAGSAGPSWPDYLAHVLLEARAQVQALAEVRPKAEDRDRRTPIDYDDLDWGGEAEADASDGGAFEDGTSIVDAADESGGGAIIPTEPRVPRPQPQPDTFSPGAGPRGKISADGRPRLVAGLSPMALMAALTPPSLADELQPEEFVAMLARGEDPLAHDPQGRSRPAQPLPVLDVLALVRLAATFGSRAGVEALAVPGTVTVLDVGGVDVVGPIARVLRRGMVLGLPPVVVDHPDEADRAEWAHPVDQVSALVVAASGEVDPRTGRWRPGRVEEVVRATLATAHPLLALVPHARALDRGLAQVLPAPRRLAPLDRAQAVAVIAATLSATGRVSEEMLLQRLPSDSALGRLSLDAICMALREATPVRAAEAMAHFANGAPAGQGAPTSRSAAPPGHPGIDGAAGGDRGDASAGTAAQATGTTVPHPGPALDDLTGLGELEEVAHILVEDLAAWGRGEARWEETTRSVLLHGEPGTGKTYAAQCIAAGAGVPLLATSLAQLQKEGHLGDLQRAMFALRDEAVARAPSILFIDEVDALGSREEASGRNASYDRKMIAGFLELLDGTEALEGVVVIGACNHLHHIDPALIRPGRFDRLVEVPRPGPVGLLRVLRHHLARELAAGCLGDAEVAALLPGLQGCTPADIAAAVRAARSAARRERHPLSLADLARALAPARELPQAVLRRAAVHEAGHAVATVALGLGEVVRLAVGEGVGGFENRRARSGAGGAVGRAEVSDALLERTFAEVHREVAQLLAGRVAEVLLLGQPSAGSGGVPGQGSDLERATGLAASLELSYGLGSSGTLWVPPDWRQVDAATRVRIAGHLARGEAIAREALRANLAALERLACALADHRALDSAEVAALLEDVVTWSEEDGHGDARPNAGGGAVERDT